MLTLTRKKAESVVLDGGRIVVTVVEVDRGKVRLGFTCDRSVPVDREEVHRAKQAGEPAKAAA